MDLDERRQRGRQLLERMLGAERAEQASEAWKRACPEFEDYVTEFLAGELWSRPGLDLRTRSLVTVAMLAALGRPLALALNVRIALNNGASERDIVETLLQAAAYAGFPAAWEGLEIARQVFEQKSEPAPGG